MKEVRQCTKDDFLKVNALKYYEEFGENELLICADNYKDFDLEKGSMNKNNNAFEFDFMACFSGNCETNQTKIEKFQK